MSAQIRTCGKSTRRRRWTQAVVAGCAFSLLAGSQAAIANGTGANMSQPSAPAAGVAQPAEYDANYWVGKNISAVVKVFGQPTSWNADHDGGAGGNRYFYTNPNQPHFVFETQPGETIVKAVKIP
jgi:hypothetical protein